MTDQLLQSFGADEPQGVTDDQHRAALASLAEQGFSTDDLEAVPPETVVRLAQNAKPAAAAAAPAKPKAEAPKPKPTEPYDPSSTVERRALARLIDFDVERRVSAKLGTGATASDTTEVLELSKRLMLLGGHSHPDQAVAEAAEIYRVRRAAAEAEAKPARERAAVAGLGSAGDRSATRREEPTMQDWQVNWMRAREGGASAAEVAQIESQRPPASNTKLYGYTGV